MSRFDLPRASSSVLSNGLKYIYFSRSENPIICLQLHIKTGSSLETDHQSGYSHFIEHISFKSTERYPNNDITDYVQSIGGSINAYTDFDSTCYYLLLPSERLDEGIMVLSQLAYQARFRDQDVALEKDIILEEIRQYENDPEMDLIEFIQHDYFVNNPIKHPILGYRRSIENATADTLRDFYQRHYTPGNAFLVACGNFDERVLHSSILIHFGDWEIALQPETTLRASYLEPENNGYRFQHRTISLDSDFIAFVMPELSELHPLSEHYLFGMRYYAIGKSSLLYKRLVEEEHLCSSVRVLSLSGLNSGVSVVLINPLDADHRDEILRILAEEFNSLMHYGIPEDEFELIKADIINGWYYGFESMENFASSLAEEELLGDYRRLYAYEDRIAGISPAEIKDALRNYWQSSYFKLYTQSEKKSVPEPRIDFGAPTVSDWTPKPTASVAAPDVLSEYVPAHFPGAADLLIYRRDTYTVHQLPNGLKILVKRVSTSPVTGFSLTTDISQLVETTGDRGANYLTTTAKLYGTERLSYADIMRSSRRFGFNIRVVHHLDTTSYKGKCFNQNLSQALSLLQQIILYPTFPPKFIKTIKEGSIDAIRRDDDYPVAKGYNSWLSLLLGKKSNLLRASGSISEIRGISYDTILNWNSQLTDLSRYCLSIVGDHEPDEIVDLVSHYFGIDAPGSKKADQQEPYFRKPLKHKKNEVIDGDQAVIHLGGFGAPASEVRETTAFHLIAQIIGGDMGSRFYNILREKHGYAYQTGFDYNSISSLGMWCAYAYSNVEDKDRALSLMQDILADANKRGLSQQELDNAIEYLVNINRFDHESVSWLASSLANLVVLGYSPDHFIDREQRLRSVSLDMVNDLCKKWLVPDNFFTHILY